MSEEKITKNDVKEFVLAAHGDLEAVQRMLALQPGLLLLPNGSETALGAACQMKRADIILFLLAQGAPLDIYAACVLGRVEEVAAFLDADPALVNAKNKQSHVKPPTFFAWEQPDVLALLRSRGAK